MSLTPTQTMPRSMLRVRHVEDRDFEVLEKWREKIFSDSGGYPIFTPSHQTSLTLVLEDEKGQVKMALLGGMVWAFIPILDPEAPFSEQDFEQFKTLIEGAESMVRVDGETGLLLYVPNKPAKLVEAIKNFAFRLTRQFVPFCHFLKPEAQKGKKQ